MRFKNLIFDMDGTILDTLEDLTDAVNYALRKNALPERSIGEVKRFVGNGIRKLIERAVPDGCRAETVEAVFRDMMEYYPEHSAEKTRAYPGIAEAIAGMRSLGCRTAVVTNKADIAVAPLCERYFPGLFDISVGERPGIRKKPEPDTVFEAMRGIGASRDDSVYIGDSDVDAMTAQNAGLPCVLVGWGFRDVETLEKLPHIHIAKDAYDLFDFLTR